MGHNHPKHIIAVSGYITNEKGETLLVKTHARPDTWESPGGQVEEGEALDIAMCREVYEETSLVVEPLGITGIYYNKTRTILSVVFQAKWTGGSLNIQPEEIKEAAFVKLTETTIGQFITRPHFKSRTLDAMEAKTFVPYETWNMDTNNLLGRLEGGV